MALRSVISCFSEGGFLAHREEGTHSHNSGNAFSPRLGSRAISYADEDSTLERNIYDIPDYNEQTGSTSPQVQFTIIIMCIGNYIVAICC